MKKLNQTICAIIFSTISFALGTILYCFGIFNFLENKIYDNRMIVTSHLSKPSDDICFIGIDQESINVALKEKNWGWPWPRAAYGQIVDYMNEGKAANVIFDMFYTEPSVYGPEDDLAFANSCRNYGKVIQTMYIADDENNSVLFPIRPLKATAALIGNITSAKDSDDIIRKARFSQFHEEKEYPALGLAPILLESTNPISELKKIKTELPLLKDDTVRLRFRGDINRYVHYNAIDIIQSWEDYNNGKEPLIHPSNFENCTVFFLLYAPGLYDICSSPISKVYPGAGIHITMLDNYLQNDFIKEVPQWVNILYLLLTSLIGTQLILITKKLDSYKKSITFSIITTISIPVLIVFIGYGLFCFNIFIQIAAPLFCFAFSFLESIFYSYATEGKQRRFIKTAFTQYLSPSVINQLLQNPERLKLGGEKRRISIFFSDIQNFTSISEPLKPEQLTDLLNKYLSEMSDIILKNEGTIDKYEGDSIIAFWNAPLNTKNHERKAIETAIECQKRLIKLNSEFIKIVGRPLTTRIGINTGEAVVGNMGSSKRFDYTMFGDSVNLTSRLESLNKEFGTLTLCTKETALNAKKQGTTLEFRKIACAKVVGKDKNVIVYSPITKEEYSKQKEQIAIFDKGLELFMQGNFKEAKNYFLKNTKDMPSIKYAQRCDYLIENPPSQWKGEWQAISK